MTRLMSLNMTWQMTRRISRWNESQYVISYSSFHQGNKTGSHFITLEVKIQHKWFFFNHVAHQLSSKALSLQPDVELCTEATLQKEKFTIIFRFYLSSTLKIQGKKEEVEEGNLPPPSDTHQYLMGYSKKFPVQKGFVVPPVRYGSVLRFCPTRKSRENLRKELSWQKAHN